MTKLPYLHWTCRKDIIFSNEEQELKKLTSIFSTNNSKNSTSYIPKPTMRIGDNLANMTTTQFKEILEQHNPYNQVWVEQIRTILPLPKEIIFHGIKPCEMNEFLPTESTIMSLLDRFTLVSKACQFGKKLSFELNLPPHPIATRIATSGPWLKYTVPSFSFMKKTFGDQPHFMDLLLIQHKLRAFGVFLGNTYSGKSLLTSFVEKQKIIVGMQAAITDTRNQNTINAFQWAEIVPAGGDMDWYVFLDSLNHETHEWPLPPHGIYSACAAMALFRPKRHFNLFKSSPGLFPSKLFSLSMRIMFIYLSHNLHPLLERNRDREVIVQSVPETFTSKEVDSRIFKMRPPQEYEPKKQSSKETKELEQILDQIDNNLSRNTIDPYSLYCRDYYRQPVVAKAQSVAEAYGMNNTSYYLYYKQRHKTEAIAAVCGFLTPGFHIYKYPLTINPYGTTNKVSNAPTFFRNLGVRTAFAFIVSKAAGIFFDQWALFYLTYYGESALDWMDRWDEFREQNPNIPTEMALGMNQKPPRY